MIIVEGPDGSGKSTLVRKLCVELGLPAHERASDSIKGPVDNLFEWAYHDVITMPDQPVAIYDRHPLLSEYVYGPVVRAKLPDGFTTSTAHMLVRMMAPRVFVVLCRPSSERLESSVDVSRDMAGVTERIAHVASAYDALRIFWPGQIITYDYEQPQMFQHVLSMCRLYVATVRSKRQKESQR